MSIRHLIMSDNFEYKDKADNCFQYSSVEVKCPAGDKGVKTIPIQN